MGTCSSSFLPVGSSRVPCMAQNGHWSGVWGVEWTLSPAPAVQSCQWSLEWCVGRGVDAVPCPCCAVLTVVTGVVCGAWSGRCAPCPCCAVLTVVTGVVCGAWSGRCPLPLLCSPDSGHWSGVWGVEWSGHCPLLCSPDT